MLRRYRIVVGLCGRRGQKAEKNGHGRVVLLKGQKTHQSMMFHGRAGGFVEATRNVSVRGAPSSLRWLSSRGRGLMAG